MRRGNCRKLSTLGRFFFFFRRWLKNILLFLHYKTSSGKLDTWQQEMKTGDGISEFVDESLGRDPISFTNVIG